MRGGVVGHRKPLDNESCLPAVDRTIRLRLTMLVTVLVSAAAAAFDAGFLWW
jgi:hypothetical protein